MLWKANYKICNCTNPGDKKGSTRFFHTGSGTARHGTIRTARWRSAHVAKSDVNEPFVRHINTTDIRLRFCALYHITYHITYVGLYAVSRFATSLEYNLTQAHCVRCAKLYASTYCDDAFLRILRDAHHSHTRQL